MRVLIDLMKLKRLKTGLGQVCLAYARELSATLHPGFHFTFLVPPAFKGHFGPNVNYITPSWLQYIFCRIRPKGIQLWHTPYQDIYFTPPRHIPWICTVHDLNFTHEKSPQKVKWRLAHFARYLKRCTQVVAISDYTKQDIERYLAFQPPVKVIYNGVSIDAGKQASKPSFMNDKPFLLAIGVFKHNKNYISLVELMRHYPDKQLVIAGDYHTPYGQKVLKLIHRYGLRDRIITPGIISNNDRLWLYMHCDALLFPSTNEGMGLPLIEAMHFGKPVIASDMSCIPEFGGNCAYYFTSFAPQAMQQTIEESLAHFRQHPERRTAMQHHAAQFSWKHNAEQYIQLFEQLKISE